MKREAGGTRVKSSYKQWNELDLVEKDETSKTWRIKKIKEKSDIKDYNFTHSERVAIEVKTINGFEWQKKNEIAPT